MSAELDALELAAVDAFRRGDSLERWDGSDDGAWIRFGLGCLLAAGRTLRSRATAIGERVERKTDGSPVMGLEREVELDLRARLARFTPAAGFVGEETGGSVAREGFTVAVDPVDGTWAFLSESPSWACVLAVLRDGQPFGGFVANPATGEVAYALRGRASRLLRLPAFGEPPAAYTLPTRSHDGELLVSLHPGRATGALLAALHAAWSRDDLKIVRSPGGSPAWGLVEAARGHYVYVNAWIRRRAEPYDLAAGTLLVRNAGGEVVDANGEPIDALRHRGPWLAGVDAAKRAHVLALLRESWPGSRASGA